MLQYKLHSLYCSSIYTAAIAIAVGFRSINAAVWIAWFKLRYTAAIDIAVAVGYRSINDATVQIAWFILRHLSCDTALALALTVGFHSINALLPLQLSAVVKIYLASAPQYMFVCTLPKISPHNRMMLPPNWLGFGQYVLSKQVTVYDWRIWCKFTVFIYRQSPIFVIVH